MNESETIAKLLAEGAPPHLQPPSAPTPPASAKATSEWSACRDSLSADSDALFGPTVIDPTTAAPHQIILREKPEHRIMILLKAEGRSNREIARVLGVTDANVSNVLRQPWARTQLTKLIMEPGRASIHKMFEAEAVPSILTLVEVRDAPNSSAMARIAASDKLLDRFLGKPVARTENVHIDGGKDLQTVEEIEAELIRAREEEARLKAN